MEQKEICAPLSVLDDSGRPQNFGWSRTPSFFYDPMLVYASKHRISESDRYIVSNPTHIVTFEIRDDGVLGFMGISVISLREKKRSTQTYNTFFPLGTFDLPTNSITGISKWRKKKTHLNFISMDEGVKIIKADIPQFGNHRSMRCCLVLTEPKLKINQPDSLVTNQPWRREKDAFIYTRCSPWYYTEGVIQFGSTEIIFTHGNGWGIFDWVRCARPKSDIRYWAAACGSIDGVIMSFCVGYSHADFSYGTENGFFVDGILHKLDQVTFHIPLSNMLSTWHFTSNDNRLEMSFFPHQARIDRRSMGFYSSTRRQVFGTFSGKIILDDGSEVQFHNLTGFAERSKVRN